MLLAYLMLPERKRFFWLLLAIEIKMLKWVGVSSTVVKCCLLRTCTDRRKVPWQEIQK